MGGGGGVGGGGVRLVESRRVTSGKLNKHVAHG